MHILAVFGQHQLKQTLGNHFLSDNRVFYITVRNADITFLLIEQ